jgi:hypothetical protein
MRIITLSITMIIKGVTMMATWISTMSITMNTFWTTLPSLIPTAAAIPSIPRVLPDLQGRFGMIFPDHLIPQSRIIIIIIFPMIIILLIHIIVQPSVIPLQNLLVTSIIRVCHANLLAAVLSKNLGAAIFLLFSPTILK